MTDKVKQISPSVSGNDEIDIGRLVGTVVEAKWWVIGITGLFAALGALSPDSRALLHLRYYEGFTVAELARQFRTTAPALSARLYRAKQQLRKKLEELGYEEALSEDF